MEITQYYFLQPGYIIICKQPFIINTIVGSCISVCLWDNVNHFGGMNHYIYAKSLNKIKNGKFGNISTPFLIKSMLEIGCRPENIKAHIIGGGQHPQLSPIIGEENSKIASVILEKYKLEIITNDIGGQIGRKIIFNTKTGEILIQKGMCVFT